MELGVARLNQHVQRTTFSSSCGQRRENIRLGFIRASSSALDALGFRFATQIAQSPSPAAIFEELCEISQRHKIDGGYSNRIWTKLELLYVRQVYAKECRLLHGTV